MTDETVATPVIGYPKTMQVYLYDQFTCEYTGTELAQHSPLDEPGTYLCPVYHTNVAPPVVAAGMVAVFVPTGTDPTMGSWEQKQDFRGKVIYNQTDNTSREQTTIGDIPAGYTLTPALNFQIAMAANNMAANITQWRDAARYANVLLAVSGTRYEWQVDAISAGLLESAVNLVSEGIIPCPATWRSADNTDIAIGIADLKNIVAAGALQTQIAYQRSWLLKDVLKRAVDKNDLTAINAITW